MQKLLRQFILEALDQHEEEDDEVHIPARDDELLVEPDFSADEADAEEKTEISAVGGGAISGVTTPLGTGPTYPKKGKKRKPAWMAASSGFGRAKPHKAQLNALSK